jgi:YD repeat-containing protein
MNRTIFTGRLTGDLVVRTWASSALRKALHSVAVLALLSVACSDDPPTGPPIDQGDEVLIRKVTQRFGIGPWGIDPNHVQFWILSYDTAGKAIKCEFYDGKPGQEQNTIYDDYSYDDDRLSRIDRYVFYGDRFINSRIETYEYDDRGRASLIRTRAWSGITDTWSEGITEFVYDEQDRMIEMIRHDNSRWVYSYDGYGNAWKQEMWPLFEVEYEGPITTTFTFDDKKNPFYRPVVRFWLPMGNANLAPLLLSLNNITGWDGYSPQTGGVIARSVVEHDYNAAGYPVFHLETARSPMTDPEPGVIFWETEYEYVE